MQPKFTTSANNSLIKRKRIRPLLYPTWKSMRERCYSPNCKDYVRYGERGIRVCDEWQNFSVFREHVLSLPNAKSKGFTLDRIDNDKNYEPGNVRWATPSQQGRNRKDNRLITFSGKTQCLVEWAEELGIRKTTLHERLRRGWPIERAFTTKVRKHS